MAKVTKAALCACAALGAAAGHGAFARQDGDQRARRQRDGSGRGGDYVLTWKDARETKSAVPFDYPRAVAQYTVTDMPPQVRQNDAGQDMVYFGGYRSGRWMSFTAKDSETAVWTTPPILHSFIVYRAVASFWYLMGMNDGTASQTYHPENSQAALGV